MMIKKGFSIFLNEGFNGLLTAYRQNRSEIKEHYLMIGKLSKQFSLDAFSHEQEEILEKKMVWFFGSARAGTTWLGTQLLNHEKNIIWKEPYIGQLLDFHRERNDDRNDIFFSTKHKQYWLPYLRKLILARTYSQIRTLDKNIIIKEPNGSGAADIIMECFPNSKIIFLVRDGRDVVDSLFDAHNKNSWNPILEPLATEKQRKERLELYSHRWKRTIGIVGDAFKNHNPNLRYRIRYEDLLKNTLEELKKVYNFLNIEVDNKDLQKIINKYQFEKIPEQKRGTGKFTRFAKPGKWRENFSEDEKEIMEEIMGPTLKILGY